MTFLFIIFGFLPSFAWLFFFLKEDVHPEPKKMITKAFLAGALITLAAAVFQSALKHLFDFFNIQQYSLVCFLVFGAIEEILKFLAAYWTVSKSRYFDEPIDAMIYMITAALGFAMIENIAVMSKMTIASQAIGVIVLRFVGATLLHALSSGIVGYYWAKSFISTNKSQWSLVIGQGLIIASLLHGVFNYLIILFKETMIYPTVFLIIVGLLIFWDFEKIKTQSETTNSSEF